MATRNLGRRAGASCSKARPDAVTFLEQDHEQVRELLDELAAERATGERRRLLGQIEKAIEVHSTIEDEIFLPAFRFCARRKDDSRLISEAVEEHRVIGRFFTHILGTDPKTVEFAERASRLRDLIENHAEAEEAELLPRASMLMAEEKLAELGQEMWERNQQLTRRSPLTAREER